jgi:hypothetical protein
MVKCQDIQFTPVSGRTVRLTGDLSKCKTEKIHDVITSLTCTYPECDYTINLGETIRPRTKSPYRVNLIRPGLQTGKTVCYDLSTARLTDSSIFILPLMGMNRTLMLWDSLFVNAFIGTEEDKDCIAILYRFSGEPRFTKFESALCSFRNFRKREDPDPYHVLFVFDVPEEAKSSYDAYLNGRYSMIDDMWKLRILEFHDFDIDGHTGKILFQSPNLRAQLEEKLDVVLPKDAELHSKPDLKFEVYDRTYYSPRKPVI